jgi:hypothetical protein
MHERSITVLHPDAHVFLGESKRDRERHVLAITVHDENAPLTTFLD